MVAVEVASAVVEERQLAMVVARLATVEEAARLAMVVGRQETVVARGAWGGEVATGGFAAVSREGSAGEEVAEAWVKVVTGRPTKRPDQPPQSCWF